MEPLIVVSFIAIFIVAVIFGAISAKKRREAMIALATRLGLSYNPGKDRNISSRCSFIDKMQPGRNRYADNILSGRYQGYDVSAFDYHYTTGSGKHTHHHHLSFFILILPALFPELFIAKEDFFSKIGQALGYDDIDFESYEFSRKFCVRSKDKKFAYDVCNARMIEYLMGNDDLSVEIDNNILSICFNPKLKPEYIEPNLDRLVAIRTLLPDYLFSRS